MNRPYVERLRIQNYGCIQDLTLAPTPIHALIGPNDSGKSTVLMAARTLTTLAAGALGEADDSGKLGAALGANPQFVIEGAVEGGVGWRIGGDGSGFPYQEALPENFERPGRVSFNPNHADRGLAPGSVPRVALGGSILLRLEPDALRTPTTLISEGEPLRLRNSLGLGLPAVYDAIISRDLPAYVSINRRFTELYPTVKSISLKNPTQSSKAIGVQLHDGHWVGADFMSEGMLYYLAFAALPYLTPAAMILIEEPENGLHPARIREVMHVLREISKTTQVLLATHSPLVVNELEPEEVTVLTRKPDEGTKGRLMKDTPNFAERSKVYALGELWVSYADGDFEGPLFKEPEPTPLPGEPVEWSESDGR
jgi:energy-coupling factor transporter ATP-binding protein EcfA2